MKLQFAENVFDGKSIGMPLVSREWTFLSRLSHHFSSCYWWLLQDNLWPLLPHPPDHIYYETCFCLNLKGDQKVLHKFCDKFNKCKAEGAKHLDTRWKKICE